MLEHLDTRPNSDVAEAEFRRLLGWPRNHVPGERALELATWARAWFTEHGRPWIYFREAAVEVGDNALRIDGVDFHSEKLRAHFDQNGVARAMLVALSAGAECEAQARSFWEAGRPDDYFFLETFGSAVVEHLVASANGRVCANAESEGWRAIAHYSPGYDGWDVSEQNKLFELIASARSERRPPCSPPRERRDSSMPCSPARERRDDPAAFAAGYAGASTKSVLARLEVLPSGMLRPKKSLLAVIGLTMRAVADAPAVPCVACSFSPCQFRRASYRHAGPADANQINGVTRITGDAPPVYSVNPRALRKWAQERLRFESRDDGALVATFRFDGTTCSNTGHPLAFEYRVALGPATSGRRILTAGCGPAPGDAGYEKMCSYLSDPERLMNAIATAPRALVGVPLDVVFAWPLETAAAGCLCTEANRAHKWRLVLETIHFALTQISGSSSTGANTQRVRPVSILP